MEQIFYKKGEIYVGYELHQKDTYIWRCGLEGNQNCDFRIHISKNFGGSTQKNVGYHGWDNNRLPTPEELHWFNECLKHNKFISYEEAMKSMNIEPIYEIY